VGHPRDPEALEQAMVELDRLREGGRLVGVISHVAALQEQIGVGLRVARTRTGSSVAVVADAGWPEASSQGSAAGPLA